MKQYLILIYEKNNLFRSCILEILLSFICYQNVCYDLLICYHLLGLYLGFLTLSNKVKKCYCSRFLYLSVYIRSNSRKYSLNVLKFTYIFHIWYSMDHTENNTDETIGSSTKILKIFRCITVYGVKFLKRILAYSSCTKHNEINICHSDVQKNVPHTGSYKRFLVYYGLF